MAIQFTANVLPLYATNVINEPEYLAIDPVRRNSPFEQSLLTLIESMRAFMAEMTTDEQSRVFQYTMARMLAAAPTGHRRGDLRANVMGNIDHFNAAVANGDTISITDANGTDAVVMAAAPYVSMGAVVADINGQLITAISVESYVTQSGGIGFRNTAGNEGKSFTIAAGAGPTVLSKMGMVAGTVVGPVERSANLAQLDALEHFMRSANITTL